MSYSKSLASAIAAVTVAGAVGLAYAQSTPDTNPVPPAPTAADTSQPASNTAPAAGTSSSMPSSTTTDNVSSGSSTDLAPKADRN